MKKRWRYVLISVLCVVVAGAVCFVVSGNGKQASIQVGSAIPVEAFKSIDGNTFQLSQMENIPVLLSFVYIPWDNSQASEDSRSQLNFIRSMCTQYSEGGLQAVLVDATPFVTGSHTDTEILLNYMFDWGLEQSATLTVDKRKKLAKAWGVNNIPTTFLILNGTVLQRWDSVAYSNQLAFSIMACLEENDDENSLETKAEANFPGLLPARQLSEQIWLVDGGDSWPADTVYAVRWLVIDGGEGSFLTVTAEHMESGETAELLHVSPETISEEEAAVLLANMPEYKNVAVGLLDANVQLGEKGFYKINATVTNPDTGNILFEGSAVILVT